MKTQNAHNGEIRLSDMLESYAGTATAERVSLEDIIRLLGNRSFGGLMLVLALPIALPIPAPGISILFGVPLVLISAQLALGRDHVWLPRWLTRRSVSRAQFASIVKTMLPTLRRLEGILKPRAAWLCNTWTTVVAGLISAVLALIIALPIPFGQVVPGFAISLFALGLIERDGVAIILGLAVTLLAIGVVIAAMVGIGYLLQ